MKKQFEYSPGGTILIDHPRIVNYQFFTVYSCGLGWDHVSITLRKTSKNKVESVERCPTWEEMCFIKDYFFDESETVVQYHPAKEDYVNNHPYCLHLWRPNGIVELPKPLSIMVGV